MTLSYNPEIMIFRTIASSLALLMITLTTVLGSGCNRPNFDPKLATRPYPYELHTTTVLPIQVFRDGTRIEIVNATDQSWTEVTVWINQRFAAPLASLGAGQRVSMDLFSFRDDLGEQFRAGGLFRTRPPATVELIEIQPRPGQPMIGLISVMPGEGA